MRRVLLVVGCIVLLAMAIPSWATVWDFNDPPTTGAVGAASWAVTEDGITLTAYGFDLPGNGAHELYWKDTGADEHGIGFTNPDTHTGNHELTLDPTSLQPENYIQIDLNGLQLIGTPGMIRVQSDTTTPSGAPEAYDIWGSNTLGVLDDTGPFTPLVSGLGSAWDNLFYSLPDWGLYRYYSVTVTAGLNPDADVLMDAIQSNVPEPGTMGLLLMGLPALGLLRRKYAK